MKTYKIRVTGDVLETVAATRRVNVSGQVLTFGHESVYLRTHELPSELTDDRHLRIEVLPAGVTVPLGSEVIDLKSERLQEPEADIAPPLPGGSGEEIDLKSERLQEPGATVLPGEPPPSDEIDLKSERLQEPGAAVLPGDPEPPPGDETDLKSERLQESTVAPAAVAARKRR
jgi:hypothetical protein